MGNLRQQNSRGPPSGQTRLFIWGAYSIEIRRSASDRTAQPVFALCRNHYGAGCAFVSTGRAARPAIIPDTSVMTASAALKVKKLSPVT